MAKNLLKEGTVRRWGTLAKISPLVESYVEENKEAFNEGDEQLEEGAEETLEEDNYDKTGPGPHREGTKKNNHDGESGVASNQGKEPPESPDGKLEIPGTGYAGDHKNSSKSPEKGSTDGGTQLHGKGNVTENKLNEMPEMEDELGGDEMGGDMPPPPGDDMGAPGEVDLQSLVGAIANAISQETGVEISVAGHAEPDGDEGLPPPVGDEAPPMDPGAAPPAEEPLPGDEEEEVVEQKFNLSEVDDAAFQQEAIKRGYAMQEGAEVQEEGGYKKDDEMMQQEAMVESIAKKVAEKLTKKRK